MEKRWKEEKMRRKKTFQEKEKGEVTPRLRERGGAETMRSGSGIRDDQITRVVVSNSNNSGIVRFSPLQLFA